MGVFPDNPLACEMWLMLLQDELKLEALVGSQREVLLAKARALDLLADNVEFYAEVPLKGKAGIDLSVEYIAKSFLDGNAMKSRSVINSPDAEEINKYGDFFHWYAKRLEGFNPELLPLAKLYLETDTFTGDAGKSAVFVNLSGNVAKELLPEVIKRQGADTITDVVMKQHNTISQSLTPWHFGFMHSRKDFSVRLIYSLEDGQWNGIPELIGEAGYCQIPKELAVLEGLLSHSPVIVMLDLDVMADGSIGPILGMEIAPVPMLPYEQRTIYSSAGYKAIIDRLKNWGIADDRVDLIPETVFSVDVQKDGRSARLDSRLSHIKLRWKEGSLMDAKAYLELRSKFYG